jgi:hypothetical protein
MAGLAARVCQISRPRQTPPRASRFCRSSTRRPLPRARRVRRPAPRPLRGRAPVRDVRDHGRNPSLKVVLPVSFPGRRGGSRVNEYVRHAPRTPRPAAKNRNTIPAAGRAGFDFGRPPRNSETEQRKGTPHDSNVTPGAQGKTITYYRRTEKLILINEKYCAPLTGNICAACSPESEHN